MANQIPADADDGNKTDEAHKKRDPDRPIHRIGQRFKAGSSERRPPSFRPELNGPTIDGKGFDRPKEFESCRRPAAVQAAASRRNRVLGTFVVSELARAVPAWILVEPHVGFPPAFSEPNAAFQEVEGKLVRSFQTWTDFPVAQWHQWYDWNFHVEPAEGYRHLAGPANKLEGLGGKTPLVKGATATMECEWDTGAFAKIQNFEAVMFRADWCWPMAQDFVWIAGRWIYDCGHANAQEQVRTELHPCAAVATARWEGVQFKTDRHEQIWPQISGLKQQFPEDTPFVPGIRFMFFGSRNGGYKNFFALANPNSAFDKNYRFIVDLPSISPSNRTMVIGEAGENTGAALNPRLLVSFSFDEFANEAIGKFQKKDPIVTVIDRGSGKLPEQVIIEIPIDQLDPDTDAYGVIVSLGWHDNANTLASRVVKCSVNIQSIELVSTQLLGSGLPWTLKIGVNGRWFRKEFPSLGPSLRPINKAFTFFLPLDHPTSSGADIKINSHGKIVKRVGNFLKKSAANRTVKLNGRVLDYDRDTILPNDFNVVDVVEELALLQAETIKEQNEAIGLIDLKESATNVAAAGGTKNFTQPALTLTEVDPLAELVFANDTPGQEKLDYRLKFVITTEPQQGV